jgi:hypothetical protein
MDQLATNATDGKPKNLLFNDDSGADETLVPAPKNPKPGSVCIIVTISRRPLAFRSMNRNIAFGIFLLTLFHGRVRT